MCCCIMERVVCYCVMERVVCYCVMERVVNKNYLKKSVGHLTSRRVIASSQRPLPDNTQRSQQTDIQTPGGIRTHNLSWRAAAGLPLRSRGHWDR